MLEIPKALVPNDGKTQADNRMDNQQERSLDLIAFDLGWLCAAIEGEGSISLTGRLYKGGAIGITPVITLTNTQAAFIERGQIIASRYTSPGYRYIAPERKPQWAVGHRVDWVGPKRVIKLLAVIEPHLIIKRAQAAVVREFCELRLSKSIKTRFEQREYELFFQSRGLQSPRHRNKELEKRLNEILRDFKPDGPMAEDKVQP